MNYTNKDHTFVICAYKENPFLEKAILSVKNQTYTSNIIVATSTPNDHINYLCRKYHITQKVNINPPSIGADWNFAYNQAKTELVTIVHQDDIYEPTFLQDTICAINRSHNVIMCFTD